MELSRSNLKYIDTGAVVLPANNLFDLPEKVLQFGTGVLLRGLPDYYIDKANRMGLFNGRIVVVKSTAQGDASAFEKQDGMYTLCVRGVQEGKSVSENIVNTAISRVLNAAGEWNEVLRCAHNPQLRIIISNTTELGIELVPEDIRKHPPKSFPGKLLAFLLERYAAFGGSAASGMVILPTELIPENGKKLESIMLELAHLNGLEGPFIEWLEENNFFCNTLVDRIVPGKPEAAKCQELEEELGYRDALLTMSEVYSMWAIEGSETVRQRLDFATADAGIIIAEDIDLYRELKLRLLNGTHTLSCGLAYLAGCQTVVDAMNDETVGSFIVQLLHEELAPSIPYAVQPAQAHAFGNKVLDRFRNPSIRHQWLSITMNYSSKMKMRCLPLLSRHYEQSATPPQLYALGFAAYIRFMQPAYEKDGKYFGKLDGKEYLIQDDQAASFYRRSNLTLAEQVQEVLADTGFWGQDLSALPGFADAVCTHLNRIVQEGMRPALNHLLKSQALSL